MTLAVIDDLMFRSKLETALEGRVVVVATLEALREQLCEPTWTRMVVDLHCSSIDPIEAIRLLRTERPGLPVIAYGSHVDVARRQQAVAAGCQDVLARSEFVQRIAAWASESCA